MGESQRSFVALLPRARRPPRHDGRNLRGIRLVAGGDLRRASKRARKWIRGGLLMVSILAMFTIGLALKGKIYSPNTGDLLDILNFAGDLGNGILYVLARALDLGQAAVQVATADYGTKFIVVAGLLNIISAVDAHSLATGRKRS